ncbi:hypothetical protein Plec18170_002234 [Paecilomyces lecythidis]
MGSQEINEESTVRGASTFKYFWNATMNASSKSPVSSGAQHAEIDSGNSNTSLSVGSGRISLPENTYPELLRWKQVLCSVPMHEGAEMGPLELDNYLLTMLKEWHKDYPAYIPPAALRVPTVSGGWKIFDTSGQKLSMSLLDVFHPLCYKMLILHAPNEPDVFVAPVYRNGAIVLYKEWVYENLYRSEICAVRVCNDNEDGIFASPFLERCLSAAREKVPVRNATSSEAALPEDLRSANLRAPASEVRSNSTSPTESPRRSPRIKQMAKNSVSKKHERVTKKRFSLAKKKTTKPSKKTTQKRSCTTGEIIIKLVAQDSECTRYFPLEVCKTVDQFFSKADEFFTLINEETHVNVLSTCVTNMDERHYIFRGEKEEFSLFVEKAQEMANNSIGKLHITVASIN